MSKFIVAPALFELFPEACFGVVVAENVDNQTLDEDIAGLLQAQAQTLNQELGGTNVREHPHIAVWREAFRKLDLNPNKFPSSIEALAKRIAKRAQLPSINKIVDLVNVLSLKYLLPMGAHDRQILPGDIELRLASAEDLFIPFGSSDSEPVDEGEIVYATGNQVRTRKWVWRQGEKAKVVPSTSQLFCPIDAFYGVTDQTAKAAQSELAAMLERHCGATTRQFWVDKDNPSVELD
ncbi:MAG: B3/4 domain-containing protein [bacterium]